MGDKSRGAGDGEGWTRLSGPVGWRGPNGDKMGEEEGGGGR